MVTATLTALRSGWQNIEVYTNKVYSDLRDDVFISFKPTRVLLKRVHFIFHFKWSSNWRFFIKWVQDADRPTAYCTGQFYSDPAKVKIRKRLDEKINSILLHAKKHFDLTPSQENNICLQAHLEAQCAHWLVFAENTIGFIGCSSEQPQPRL